ncbi:MAG: queuosine precursor transporter [Gammaproteobacteria bacterium]
MMKNNIIRVFPKYLWLLMLSYAVVIILANWVDARLVQFGPLITDGGTLIFPLTFVISDVITEVYGYKHARRAIWCGFLFNSVTIFFGLIISSLPSPDFATNNDIFDQILAINFRITAASTLSYLISEPLNSLIMAKLKIKTAGKLMWLRFVFSTLLASGADSFIFGTLAFYGTMSSHDLLMLIFGMWFIKVLIEVAGLPISIPLSNKLKQLEQLDMYDDKTNFNLLSLDGDYQTEANHFHQEIHQ